jgi:guanidinopropionase
MPRVSNEAGGVNKLWMGLHNPRLAAPELDVAIFGVPYDGSVSHAAGAAHAPAVLREISASLWPHTETGLSLRGLRLCDLGDVAVVAENATATQAAITAAIRPIVNAGVIPLVLGGDHSISPAAVAAFSSASELGVLWLDSHPDLMDSFGSVRGKEESRWSHACPLRRILELPNVRKENALLLGIRDFIPEEQEFIETHGIEVVYAWQLSRLAPGRVMERVRQKFAHLSDVYVSFDIDVLDPACAPGTGVPIPGGISSRYLYDLLLHMFELERRSLAQTGQHFLRVAGFDVVEIAPPLDVGQLTSLAGMGIITSMLGYIALQVGLIA